MEYHVIQELSREQVEAAILRNEPKELLIAVHRLRFTPMIQRGRKAYVCDFQTMSTSMLEVTRFSDSRISRGFIKRSIKNM